jgi:outer membrane protein
MPFHWNKIAQKGVKKMRIVLSYFLMFLGLLLVMPAYPQTAGSLSLTIEEAVKLVLEHNYSLSEAEDAIAIFTARADESRSGFFPNMRMDLAYNRIGPVSEMEVPPFGSFKLYPANNYDFHAGVRQLLFDFKRTAEAVNLARSQIDTAVDRWDLIKRDLEYQTVQLFYGILFLQENIRVQEEHIKILNEHLETTKRKVQSGTATDLEVLNTQVRVAVVQNQKNDLENILEKQVILLHKLAGIDEKTELQFNGEFSHQPIPLGSEELVNSALTTRLEWRAVHNQIKVAEAQQQLASLHDKPSVNLNLLFGTKNGYMPNLNRLKLNFIAAIQADIPIFDGNLTSAMKAEASANLKAIQDRGKEIEDIIKSEVLQAISDIRTAELNLKLVEINIQQAKKALEYAKMRYEAGTITNLDLFDVEEAHSEAEFMRSQALYKFMLSKLALQRAVGKKLI